MTDVLAACSPDMKVTAPVRVNSDSRTCTTPCGLVEVAKYANPLGGSMAAVLKTPSFVLRVREPTRVKSDSRTLITMPGLLMLPKYAKPPDGSITADSMPASPEYRVNV